LSVLDEATYQVGAVTLTSGDLLLLYTDGVVEVMTREGEEFGLARLQAVLRDVRALPAAVIINAIIQTTQRYAGSTSYPDDYTLMVVRCM